MSRPPSFAVKATAKGWLVHVPASLSDTGTLSRRYFTTRDGAKKFAKKLRLGYKADGEKASVLPPRVADDALTATKILKSSGLTLRDAAREVTSALAILGEAGSIREAVLAHRALHDARMASKPLRKAVKVYNVRCADLRAATKKSYASTLSTLLEPLQDHMVADIKVSDLDTLLKNVGKTSRKTHIRNLRAFWTWAAKKPRQWAQHNALEGLEIPPQRDDSGDIEILRVAEVKALLAAAELENPAAAASYALAIFAGIRMDELPRLVWGNINEESVELDKRVTKKSLRRNTPLCPTLKAWLAATRGNAKDTDRIVPKNWIEVSKAVRRRAGWEVVARIASDEVKEASPTRGKWKANAPRHTCASIQVTIGTSLKDLIFQFGHSGGEDLLRRHYVRKLMKKEALEILSIGPNGTKIEGLA
jgi:integrase